MPADREAVRRWLGSGPPLSDDEVAYLWVAAGRVQEAVRAIDGHCRRRPTFRQMLCIGMLLLEDDLQRGAASIYRIASDPEVTLKGQGEGVGNGPEE